MSKVHRGLPEHAHACCLRHRQLWIRPARRPLRPPPHVEPEHSYVFHLHLCLRLLNHRHYARRLPFSPRPRHGRRVEFRRNAGCRNLAQRLARTCSRNRAKQLGHWLRARRHRRQSRARARQLALGLLRGRPSRAGHAMDPEGRSRTSALAAPARISRLENRKTRSLARRNASLARAAEHEHVRHVRLVGPLHLDSRLPRTPRLKRRPRLRNIWLHRISDHPQSRRHAARLSAYSACSPTSSGASEPSFCI